MMRAAMQRGDEEGGGAEGEDGGPQIARPPRAHPPPPGHRPGIVLQSCSLLCSPHCCALLATMRSTTPPNSWPAKCTMPSMPLLSPVQKMKRTAWKRFKLQDGEPLTSEVPEFAPPPHPRTATLRVNVGIRDVENHGATSPLRPDSPQRAVLGMGPLQYSICSFLGVKPPHSVS